MFPHALSRAVPRGRRVRRWHHGPVTYARAVPEAHPAGRPVQVVAHRGASADLPEHTLAAYRKAIEDGADALDCDVRLTADGELVCVHDRRLNRTSDGRGPVSSRQLVELRGMDFGEGARTGMGTGTGAGPDTGGDGAEDRGEGGVLTLRRLLELVADTDRRIEVAIETKHPTRWSGQVETRLVDLLRHFGLDRPTPHRSASHRSAPYPTAPEASPQVRVMSFSARALRRVRDAAPAVPTVFLMLYVLPSHRAGQLPAGAGIAGTAMRILRADPGYVARLHRAGHRVHVWTVDEPADVELCVRLGVDAIITNRPGAVLAQLGR